jgi:HEAT repeat protein
LKRIAFLILVAVAASAQSADSDPKQRVRAVRELSKQNDDAISKIVPYVSDADVTVRVEATKALVEIGGPKTIDGLLKAAADNDPEVQIRATDGLVNIYLPGYIKTGFSGTLSRAGNSVRGKFSDTNDQVIDAYVMVRPEVITALGKIARGAASLEARTNATRALGVLRGRAALADVIEGLHSKDDKLMYEALVAIEKIGDPAAAPRVTFLLRDLAEKIRVEALETTGLLHNKDAAPEVRDALEHARSAKEKRAALEALAQIADPADRTLFLNNLQDKDDGVRAAAVEGVGRLRNPTDLAAATQAFTMEHGMNPRLAAAYAMVSLGKVDTERFGPLRYLVNALNQKIWRGVASAYVIELAREAAVRQAIYTLLAESTKDEKQQIALVLASSGDRDSVSVLEGLSRDPDADVAAEGIRSLRILRARLP